MMLRGYRSMLNLLENLKIDFVLVNCADTDEMSYLCDISSGSSLFAKVHVTYPAFMGFWSTKG